MLTGKTTTFLIILIIGFSGLSVNQLHDLIHPCSNLTEDFPIAHDHNGPTEPHSDEAEDCGQHCCMWSSFVTILDHHSIGQIDQPSLLPFPTPELLPDSPELDGIDRPPSPDTI
ncbi:hypothetical protein KKA00_09080 [bacterium]|nr:hypothetical protein [bacterium]